ncbi:hypothetical protein ACET3Z_015620 [Daucus carota]
METAISSVVEKIQKLAISTQDFADAVIRRHHASNRRNPIEILKRLQREAFSDIMKIRDRQDKVERLLLLNKTSKGTPFQEAGTRLRGDIDVLGALLMLDHVDEQHLDAIQKAGIKTGASSMFTFQTTIRETDTLTAEFATRGKDHCDVLGSPLSLEKVHYKANISDWFSIVSTPLGAQCKDFAIKKSSCQEKGPTNFSFSGPPFLNEQSGSAIGLMVRKANVVASLAQFVSELGMQSDSTRLFHCFSTFGQVMCQLSGSTKLSLLGIHRVPKFSKQQVKLGPLVVPGGIFKRGKHPESPVGTSSSSFLTNTEEDISSGSLALTLETELDDSTKIGGWIEMKNSNPRHLHWAVTMADTPDDDFGWGLSLGGLVQGPSRWDHFQVEAFLRMNLGDRFSLQPGLAYVMNGATQFPVATLRSTWSM